MCDSEAIVDETCEDVNQQNNDRHWVEALFPPTFRLSVQEDVSGSITTAVRDRHGRELTSESVAGENEELFVKLARRTPPLDVDAVKNVYQRVWYMMSATESARNNKKEQSQEVEENDHIQPSLRSDEKQPAPCDADIKHDSCIWDSNEMDVLRRVFKATSDENAHLCSQVCVLQNDVEKMITERCAQRRSLESTRHHLHRAMTANKRLQMLVNHLKMELNQTTNELDCLRSVEAERNDLSSRLQKMQSELSAAECDRERDIAVAEAKWLKVVEEQRLAETTAKTQLNNDVARLTDKVAELEQQLNKERADHSRTRTCLEHLRIHFSCMPTSGGKSNSIYKDELANWTY